MKSVTPASTIHDVARKAGVSAATVSRVLNGTAGVREPARLAVNRAIQELSFVPNPIARRLSLGKTFTVAAIVPFFTRPSFVERLRGISRAFEDSGYELIVYNIESGKRRDQLMRDVPRSDRVDGVVVMSMSPSDADVVHLTQHGLPVVLVDAEHPNFISIKEDSADGGRLATEHLIGLGHRSIGFVGGPLTDMLNPLRTSTRYRLDGYQFALTSAGIAYRDELVAIDQKAIGATGPDPSMDQLRAMLAQPNPPTAIFAASDQQAMSLMHAAQELGISIPDQLSIIGYDDLEISHYLNLSTVNQSLFESGQRAGELLLQTVSGRQAYAPTHERLQPSVVVRRTTAAPAKT